MMSSNLSRRMQELFDDTKGLDSLQELELLDQRLVDESDQAFIVQLKITKASVLSELGRDHEALQIFDECSRSPHGDESANYFAAEFLVKRHRYIEAEAFLERAEEQVAIRKSAYYNNCIHLLHAYCAAKLGKFDKARQLLGRMFDVDGDEEIFWVPVRPVISISTVQELIAKGLPES